MKIKFTAGAVKNLKPQEKEYRAYFEGYTGFGVKVFPSGEKSYFIDYKINGKKRRMTLAKVSKVAFKDLLKLYTNTMLEINSGNDPLVVQEPEEEVLLSEWIAEYIRLIKPNRKHTSADEGYLNFLRACLGNIPITQVTRRQIINTRAKIIDAGKLTKANRWGTAVCSCFNAAVEMELITKNPAAKLKQLNEEPRNKVFTEDEMTRLRKAIDKEEPYTRAAFLIMINTGCRVGEILKAEWKQFDLDGKWWTIPSSVSKNKKTDTIPINDEVVETLNALIPGKPNDAVIKRIRRAREGADKKFRPTLNSAWSRIRAEAELPEDLRIHDIRRTFGLKVALNHGIYIASKLLRHSSVKITERAYAPLGVEEKGNAALRDAVS